MTELDRPNSYLTTMAKICGIYLLTHTASGRKYVGQSIDVKARWYGHSRGRSGSGILCSAIQKYGWDAFSAEVIQACDRDDLNAAEVYWIDKLQTQHPSGFNLTTGGQQYRFTDAARAIISEATRKGLTPEVIAKRAASIRGVPKSAEHRAKMSAAKKNPANIARMIELAKNQSAETREKIAASKRGRVVSAETRARISATKNLPENRIRSSEAARNISDETRAKRSASCKAGWARRLARLRAEKEAAA